MFSNPAEWWTNMNKKVIINVMKEVGFLIYGPFPWVLALHSIFSSFLWTNYSSPVFMRWIYFDLNIDFFLKSHCKTCIASDFFPGKIWNHFFWWNVVESNISRKYLLRISPTWQIWEKLRIINQLLALSLKMSRMRTKECNCTAALSIV